MKVPLCKLEEIPEQGLKAVEFFGRELASSQRLSVPPSNRPR